ncbi:hypothetical protein B0A49_02037 [Cryomyces minteri]|uniref:DUF1857-domain-containing protein n=1 Tax=Cryomyces minteri TaxID=331657 RepID=A0A4U0XZI1_9PEZI|nr:hypothetical protein B0A49_02037 [Cryomyces minteri]
MVTLNLAYTAPINPPSASPVLTSPQLWAGLQRKIRHAQEFVPAIVSCTVLDEQKEDNGSVTVTREVQFKEGYGPKEPVREVCRSWEPAKVVFHQPDGSTISNIISDGPSGQPSDFSMTYTFQWLHPGIEPGSKEEAEALAMRKKTAKMAVEKSIESIRRMVKEGEIA